MGWTMVHYDKKWNSTLCFQHLVCLARLELFQVGLLYLFSLSAHQHALTTCTDSPCSFRHPRCTLTLPTCVLRHSDCLPQVFLCACILPISTMTHPLLSIRFRQVQTSSNRFRHTCPVLNLNPNLEDRGWTELEPNLNLRVWFRGLVLEALLSNWCRGNSKVGEAQWVRSYSLGVESTCK